jgi:hypothetical protein
MINKFQTYHNINEQKKLSKENKKISSSFMMVFKLLIFNYDFSLTNIIPLHKLFQILFKKYNLDNYDISLLIVNQLLKEKSGNKNDYDKLSKELKIHGVDIFYGVVQKSISNINLMMNMIMKNYHLYYDKEDIFMKKYMIPVIYLITRYVDNYDVNIMDFSDLIVLDDNVFKNMQEFIIKSLETSREKYQYFFDKIS